MIVYTTRLLTPHARMQCARRGISLRAVLATLVYSRTRWTVPTSMLPPDTPPTTRRCILGSGGLRVFWDVDRGVILTAYIRR